MTKIEHLEKKIFPQTIPLRARTALVTTLKKNCRRKSFFSAQNQKKVETMCKVLTYVFPQNLPGLRWLQFCQPRRIFSLKLKKSYLRSFSIKNRGFSLLRKASSQFYSLVIYSTFGNPDENFSPVSQNLIFNPKDLKFLEMLSKMLLEMCSSRQRECRFDNPAKHFSVENHIGPIKVQK